MARKSAQTLSAEAWKATRKAETFGSYDNHRDAAMAHLEARNRTAGDIQDDHTDQMKDHHNEMVKRQIKDPFKGSRVDVDGTGV